MSAAISTASRTQLKAPRGPTLEEWERMPAATRAALEQELGQAAIDYESDLWASLSQDERTAMAESEAHQDASYGSRESLRAFFLRAGRPLFIASNLPVFYPGEDEFSPDLLAAWDVPLRRRKSYIVVQEGKGLDLAIEVLYCGDRKKDLVTNVTLYARLGIREYFVVDLARRRIYGYRLEAQTARRYTPLLGSEGRYRSTVLDLDLGIEGDFLRFYAGTAVVPLLSEEVMKLAAQVQQERELAAAAEEKAASAEEQAASAKKQAASAKKQATSAKKQAAAAEKQAAAAEDRLRQQLVQSLLMVLRLRGLALDKAQEARVLACQDSALLQGWLSRAATASVEDLFLDR